MSAPSVHSLLSRRIKHLTTHGGTHEEVMKAMRAHVEQERQAKIAAQQGSDNIVRLAAHVLAAR